MGTREWPDNSGSDAAERRDVDADEREEAADRREQRDDARERVLDRWERELAARAAELHVLDEVEEATRERARLEREENHARRRAEAEARRDAAIERDIERARRAEHDARSRRSGARAESDESVALARLAALLQSNASLAQVLDAILTAALSTVTGSAAASVSLMTADGVEPAASTAEWAAELDAAQLETGSGPLLEAVDGQTVVVTADLSHDERWPRLADRIASKGARGVLSIGLRVGGEATGALTVYGKPGVRFGRQSLRVAGLLAAHVSVALGWTLERLTHEAQTDAWERGLASRDMIGQAKGILMEQRSVTADEAFYLLRTTSQRLNQKLRDVAEHVVTQRRLPDPPGAPDPKGPR